MGWECDTLSIPYNGAESVKAEIYCYEFHVENNSRQWIGNKVLVGKDINIEENMDESQGPIKGYTDFTLPTVQYYPYENWSGSDYLVYSLSLENVSNLPPDGGGPRGNRVDINISFTDISYHECAHNRVPMQRYIRINNSGPLIPTHVECVLPIHINNKRSDNAALTRNGNGLGILSNISSETECNNSGGKWNSNAGAPRGTGECQARGIPDPYFRKNYITFE